MVYELRTLREDTAAVRGASELEGNVYDVLDAEDGHVDGAQCDEKPPQLSGTSASMQRQRRQLSRCV